jgi:hypothetical protein
MAGGKNGSRPPMRHYSPHLFFATLTHQPSGLKVWSFNFTGFLYSSVSFSREIEQQAGFLNEP